MFNPLAGHQALQCSAKLVPEPIVSQVRNMWSAEKKRSAPFFVVLIGEMPTSSDKAAAAPAASTLISLAGARLKVASCFPLRLRLGFLRAAGSISLARSKERADWLCNPQRNEDRVKLLSVGG